MDRRTKGHVVFWRKIARFLKRGDGLPAALQKVKKQLKEPELKAVVANVLKQVEAGTRFSDALGSHESTFMHAERLMARAGEAGGVLDVIAGRLVDGLKDGSFPVAESPSADDPVRYWRAFGRLLSSGVPVYTTLEVMAEEVAGPGEAEATRKLRQAVLDGSRLSEAMRLQPEVFPEVICERVEEGEQQSRLDMEAFAIADALSEGTLEQLTSGRDAMKDPVSNEAHDYVNRLLMEASDARASDIHFVPTHDSRGVVLLRVDGVLREYGRPAEGLFSKAVNSIKLMSKMDVVEERLPQDGVIKLKVRDKPIDLRICVVPTALGQRMVIRLLSGAVQCLTLEQLGLLDDEVATIRELYAAPQGFIVVNGPTGCGKTTQLYAMLQEMNKVQRCIMTVEDPVELVVEGIGQMQVDTRRGLTFPRALRSILRQDPDVIFVGEIRDLETLQCCVQSSLTGHLVLSTLHAVTSPGAVKRLVDIGLPPFLVNSTLLSVISQRLVRMLCQECKQPGRPADHSLSPEAVEAMAAWPDATFYDSKGCDACAGTGYHGRTAIHEILVMNEAICQIVAEGADLKAIFDAARAAGMRTQLASGLEKASRGLTSIQEVLRIVPIGPNP